MTNQHDSSTDPMAVDAEDRPDVRHEVSRRSLLGGAFAAGSAGLMIGAAAPSARAGVTPKNGGPPQDAASRHSRAFRVRVLAASRHFTPIPMHVDNGDEAVYPDLRGTYSKGLPHDGIGEVDAAAYSSFLDALDSGRPQDFEAIILGNPGGAGPLPGITPVHKLINPQAGLAFDLEGADCQQHLLPPAPTFASAWAAGEIVENYWMAHLRDVPFQRYVDDPLAQQALADLNALSDYRGPLGGGGQITAQELFRDDLPGCLVGPYVSQFFCAPMRFGSQDIDLRMRTSPAGDDYLTNQADWLARQNGINPPTGLVDGGFVYMRNGRDLGSWVHIDELFQAYMQAFLAMGSLGVPANPGNPYGGSATQIGFGTLGGPNFLALLCEVSTRALKAVWFQKWFVHRRLRPEVFGGRVHVHLTGQKAYDVHADALGSQAVAEAFSNFGTYLLPMAFPEGSPAHPSYGAGHATVAGACVTMLKALLDTEHPVTDFFQPLVATDDGQALVPYTGADAGSMTIAGELNKIASNVATGRNHAGVHWRTDGIESLRLGEAVAISVLRDTKLTYNEQVSFTFTKFDGTPITI